MHVSESGRTAGVKLLNNEFDINNLELVIDGTKSGWKDTNLKT